MQPSTSTPIVTETPWHIEAYDALGLGVWRHTVKDARGDLIASVYGDGADEQPGPKSRLIAAAPDMYDALNDLVGAFCADDCDHTGCDYKMASRALAKAEGRES